MLSFTPASRKKQVVFTSQKGQDKAGTGQTEAEYEGFYSIAMKVQ